MLLTRLILLLFCTLFPFISPRPIESTFEIEENIEESLIPGLLTAGPPPPPPPAKTSPRPATPQPAKPKTPPPKPQSPPLTPQQLTPIFQLLQKSAGAPKAFEDKRRYVLIDFDGISSPLKCIPGLGHYQLVIGTVDGNDRAPKRDFKDTVSWDLTKEGDKASSTGSIRGDTTNVTPAHVWNIPGSSHKFTFKGTTIKTNAQINAIAADYGASHKVYKLGSVDCNQFANFLWDKIK